MLQRHRELRGGGGGHRRFAAFRSLVVVGHFVEDRRRRDRLPEPATSAE
ncbi:hypothetical protein [Rhodococcus sp. OK519]